MGNKKRSESNADRVQRFFKEHPERTHRITQIASATGLSGDQVRGAISYLNAKAKAGNAISIECVERGKRWRYMAPPEPPEVRKRKTLHERLDDAERATSVGMQGVAQAAQSLRETENRFPAMGPAQAARLLDAKGHEDKPVGRNDFARLTTELGNMHFTPVITLKKVGETPEGYAIGKDEDRGTFFKVVPL